MKKPDLRSFPAGLIGLFTLAHFSHHVVISLATPLLPFIRDNFALDYTQAGLVLSAFSLTYGLSQLPGGWLADRLGPRVLIIVGISGVALIGLIAGLSQTYLMMIALFVLMGVAGGGYHPAAPPVISASVKPEHRGRALGFHGIGGSGSLFLAPVIGVAIAHAWGWRGSYIVMAIPTLLFGIILYVLLGRRSELRAIGERQKVLEKIPLNKRVVTRLTAVIVLSTLAGGITAGTVSFLPLYAVDHYGISNEAAALFLSLFFSSGLWASPLGGYISDRVGSIPVILVACFLAGPAIYLLNLSPYGFALGALVIFMGMLHAMRMPVSESFITSQTPEHRRSTVFGIYYFLGMESGGVITPVMGSLIDNLGFNSSFMIAASAIVAVTLASSVFLWGIRKSAAGLSSQ